MKEARVCWCHNALGRSQWDCYDWEITPEKNFEMKISFSLNFQEKILLK